MGMKCKISDRECNRNHDCMNDYCQIMFTKDLGFETLEQPTKDGKYLCRIQFYKDEDDTEITEVEFYGGEWKLNSTWNLLGWKEK